MLQLPKWGVTPDAEVIVLAGGAGMGKTRCAEWLAGQLTQPNARPWLYLDKDEFISCFRDVAYKIAGDDDLRRKKIRTASYLQQIHTVVGFIRKGFNVVFASNLEDELKENSAWRYQFEEIILNTLDGGIGKVSYFWLTANDEIRRSRLNPRGNREWEKFFNWPAYLEKMRGHEKQLGCYVSVIDSSNLTIEQVGKRIVDLHTQSIAFLHKGQWKKLPDPLKVRFPRPVKAPIL